MFGFDVEKLFLFGVIALVVIGPKELPTVMRSAGRLVRKIRSVRDEIERQFFEFTKDAELDAVKRDLDEIGSAAKLDFANNPAIAMRGHLPGQAAGAESEAMAIERAYASPEMRTYLAPDAAVVDSEKGGVG
jgi:sec-independent protein translocase protein TatB